ncbi:VWA domain-containing protein [Caldichromatium japonicum]|uniref:VWA domain-containing protein n=1 Tax=Caldichromatium japonicum TaxID=2699430 RepID=A0A6G7VCY9_9GAMM|nr:VWA domain-containing protein [Caldichromatium japonicum]QIK37718.1 VWA domain-containing protein [Caldichromatium japonicum]
MDDIIKGTPLRRRLHFYLLLDNSGSMAGEKIAAVNRAVQELVVLLGDLENEELIEIQIGAIRFGSGAEWHLSPRTPLAQSKWSNLDASGVYTSTADAIQLLADELTLENLGVRNIPPVAVLLSDGFCTQPEEVYQAAIERLNASPWGIRAVRLSIGIGEGYDKESLDFFISPYLRRGDSPIETLEARDVASIGRFIQRVSTEAVRASSRSKSSSTQEELPPVDLTKEDLIHAISPDDVF